MPTNLEVNGLEVIKEKTSWDSLLKHFDAFDFYHTYDYHDLSKDENETPILLKYTENNIIIALPLLIRTIPGTNYKDVTSVYGYAGPIYKGNMSNFNNTCFKKVIIDYFKKNNYISIFSRLNPFIPNQCKVLTGIGTIEIQGKIVNINLLNSIEKQRQIYQSRLKTHINKARRHCTIKKATTDTDLQVFKEIYFENMDRVKAKKYYYFKDSYFNKIVNADGFKSEILLAIDNETGKAIAGCQFITTNEIVQYHLSGTKTDYLNLNPAKMLIDEMRLIATKRGKTFLNLGGGLGGSEEDSLFNFKSSFSKDFKDFNLWKLIIDKDVYNDLVNKKGVDKNSSYFPLYRALNNINVNI